MKEHLEILSIIKEKLGKIPENEMIEYNAVGDSIMPNLFSFNF